MVQTKTEVFAPLTPLLPNQLRRYISQQGSRSRRAKLIRYYVQTVALDRQSQDGFGEIAPMRSDHPTRTKDQVSSSALLDRGLTGLLGAAIDILRVREVIFGIGALLSAIKHIIGGVMHDQCALFRRFFPKHSGSDGIDGVSQLRFRLCL